MAGCNIGANAVVVDTFVTSRVPPRPLPPAVDPAVANPSILTYVDQSFYELTGLETATTVEPGRSDRVDLKARPVGSDFPTDLDNIVDIPVTIFYDLQDLSGNVQQYNIASYTWSRGYTTRKSMENEVLLGSYEFQFPRRFQPKQNTILKFDVTPMVEGYKSSGVPGGFRFVNTGPFADGFAQYDYRVVNSFEWSGIVPSTVAGTDIGYLSFKSVSDATAPAGATVFPPVAGLRIRLTSPYLTTYSLPPGFFGVNSQAVLELTIERQTGTGLGAVSSRTFQLPIKFVNTFAGFAAVSFPESTPAVSKAAGADPDGDGISNWVEWLSGSNPNKANPPKTLSALSFVPASAAKSGEPSGGFWQMTMQRGEQNLETGNGLTVESSTDLKNWSELPKSSDPQWAWDDSGPLIKVYSKSATLTDKRYFRVKYKTSVPVTP